MKITTKRGIAVTLLGTVSLTGWGCAQILGADFDRPLAETTASASSGGGGAGAGGAPSTGSLSTGITSTGSEATTTASATTASAATGTSTGASASSGTDPMCGMPCATTPAGDPIPTLVVGQQTTGECHLGTFDCSNGGPTCLGAVGPLGDDLVCGPTGKDENCDGFIGFATSACKVKTIHTLLANASSCIASSATNAVTSDDPLKLGSPFNGISVDMMVFGVGGPGIAPVYSCTFGGSFHAFAVGKTCIQTGYTEDGVDPIGYIATMMAPGYEPLHELITTGGHHVLVPESKMGSICCYGTCIATTYFLPQ
ncbi:MAG: hypothetical protein ABJE95_14960 [Byssovorax sp.]